MIPKILGGTVAGVGIAIAVLWASGFVRAPFLPVLALLLVLAGATVFGKTMRFAQRVSPFIGKSVSIRVWGGELPGNLSTNFVVNSVVALGAGLHLYLCSPQGTSPIHLKIAQPRDTEITDNAVTIHHAKYIQWAGRKLAKDNSECAFTLQVQT